MATDHTTTTTSAAGPPATGALVVVVTGGDEPPAAVAQHLPADAVVVAADAGIVHARVLGLPIHVAVGDFDSVPPDVLDAVTDSGAVVERHPSAKDHTDLELALERAMGFEPDRIVVVGGHGGRIDHFLGNVLVLASSRFDRVAVEAFVGPARIHVVRPGRPALLHGETGELVSLLPVHGPARGVRTRGLHFPLHGDDLLPGSTRGVSNVLDGTDADVSLADGTLLVVLPGPPGHELQAAADPGAAHPPPSSGP